VVSDPSYNPSVPTYLSKVLLGPGAWGTYFPFRLLNGRAIAITSVDVETPIVDGILLESGSEGQWASAAMMKSLEFSTNLQILGAVGDVLWLAKTKSQMTNLVPSLAHGDAFSLPIGRKTGQYSFVFDPSLPTKL
jgi:hypothetical protein